MNKNHQLQVKELLFENGTYCAGKWRAASKLEWLNSYDGSSISEKVWNVLYKRPSCFCGNKTKYINFERGYREFCSLKCIHESPETTRAKSARHSNRWSNPEWAARTSLRMKQAHFNNRAQKKLDELLKRDIVPLDDLSPGFNNDYRWKHSCGEVFIKTFKRTFLIYCPRCHVSRGQGELYEVIRKNYQGKILVNDRQVIAPLEIDIYLPELKLGFEFNGRYWQQGNGLRKAEKVFEAQESNIKLINILEIDWIKNRKEQEEFVLSFLRS
jgi:hypothetical protein